MMRKRKTIRLAAEQLEDRIVPAVLDLTGAEFRTIDGTDNNPIDDTQGAAETTQVRFGYGDDFPDDNGDTVATGPNARTVSNALLAQSGDVLTARHLTDWAFQW